MGATLRRRAVSVTAVILGAVALTVSAPVWVPLAVLADVVRGRWRMPVVRLMLFALCWAWLESIGVAVAAALWIVGRSRDASAHYRLQRWWARGLVRALRVTVGLRVAVEGAEALGPGPHVALCRHASIADSLVSAWVFGTVARRRPRYVLKRELGSDPCLDIVGRRLPNYFVDRGAADTARELEGIARMTEGMEPGDIAVIFAEGTRASAAKRTRILERMRTRDPVRADKMSALRHLIPPKVSGPARLIESVPGADVVCVWHTGFDGLDTFGGMVRALGAGRVAARFVVDVHSRDTVPGPDRFADWLDDTWLKMDAYVEAVVGTNRADGATGTEVDR